MPAVTSFKKVIVKNFKIVLLILLIGLISCKKEKIDGKINGEIITDPEFASELNSSPEIITIGNNTFVLTTYLWRNFMPFAEEDGSSLTCINSLTEKDSLSIASTIELKKQYVIKGNEIWTAGYSEIRTPHDYIIEGVVREGPKWGPGINVYVVCEFESNGTVYRILAKSQEIKKTE